MVSVISTNGQIPGRHPCARCWRRSSSGWNSPATRWAPWPAGRRSTATSTDLQIGEMERVFIVHPDDIREVLVTQASKFIKDFQYRDPKAGIPRYLGNGLLTSDGEFWKRQRRLVTPAFRPQRMKAYTSTMVDYATRMLAGWSDKAAGHGRGDAPPDPVHRRQGAVQRRRLRRRPARRRGHGDHSKGDGRGVVPAIVGP